MKLAKAAGVIEKFPTGGDPRVRIRSRDPGTARLERNTIAAIEAMLTSLPAVPDKPAAELSVDELQVEVTRKALIFNLEVLQRPIDGAGIAELKREIALATPQLPRRKKVARVPSPKTQSAH